MAFGNRIFPKAFFQQEKRLFDSHRARCAIGFAALCAANAGKPKK